MQITFTRLGQNSYKTVITRDDKVILEVPSYDRPKWLPHDLAHYVIELNLSIKEGFWGRVAAGAVFPNMKVLEGRQPPHAVDRSKKLIKVNSERGTEAEILVGLLVDLTSQNLDKDWSAVQTTLTRIANSANTSAPDLTHAALREICGKLREKQQEWSKLALEESISVTWPTHLTAKS